MAGPTSDPYIELSGSLPQCVVLALFPDVKSLDIGNKSLSPLKARFSAP